MPHYTGGCHCGEIRFSVEGPIDEVADCNCSICRKTAYLHWEVAPEAFTLEQGEGVIQNYQFGTRTSHNYFCSACGISPFRRSRSAPQCIDVNARCLDDVPLAGVPIVQFDGVHWEEHMATLQTQGAD